MNQRNLAGKRGSLRHSTTSFSANVEGKALDNIDLNQMSHRYVSGVLQNDFPQALYILRDLEKFENSIKIHFFIREITANFNNFQGNSTSAQKLLLT